MTCVRLVYHFQMPKFKNEEWTIHHFFCLFGSGYHARLWLLHKCPANTKSEKLSQFLPSVIWLVLYNLLNLAFSLLCYTKLICSGQNLRWKIFSNQNHFRLDFDFPKVFSCCNYIVWVVSSECALLSLLIQPDVPWHQNLPQFAPWNTQKLTSN